MDFLAATLFLFIYFVRPQEWAGFLSSLQPARLVLIFGLITLLSRHRGLNLGDIFRTPHDWVVVALLLWIVFTSTNVVSTFWLMIPFYLTYLIVQQSLSSMRRLELFLIAWAGFYIFLAALALLPFIGIDPLGSKPISDYAMKGRLVVNLSIFNNPNALGHTLAPLPVLLYLGLAWNRPVFSWVGFMPLLALPLTTIYFAQSKGAFLSAFISIFAGLLIGRNPFVQVILIVAATTIGWSAVQSLPRMESLSSTDPGIAGRLVAFSHGYETIHTLRTGVGLYNFSESVGEATGFFIASHSSYNQIGTELGFGGLTLYLAIIFFSLKTLITAKPTTIQEDRVRRMIFTIVISFVASGWMVDFGFRSFFFIFAAAAAAYHRLLLLPDRSQSLDDLYARQLAEAQAADRAERAQRAEFHRARRERRPPRELAPPPSAEAPAADAGEAGAATPAIGWRGFKWYDFVLIYGMLVVWMKVWHTIITRSF